jgi:GGDEF domain-containing protein
MPLRRQKVMMVLEGVPDVPGLEAASGCTSVKVLSPLHAATAVDHWRPRLLVMRGDVAWHRELISRIPADQRPVTLVFGDGPAALELADEWFAAPPEHAEGSFRLRLAAVRAQERRRLARRAFVDTLTGLPNRRALIRALVREAARSRRSTSKVAVVLIDLDHFKQVNDTRHGDVCGRIGGDEFALLLNGDAADAEAGARRLRQDLQAIGVSATFSYAVLGPEERLRAFYRRTDAMLFAAKARRDVLGPPQFDAPAHGVANSNQASAPRPRHFNKEEVHVLGMQ